jgi:hypothetical protein
MNVKKTKEYTDTNLATFYNNDVYNRSDLVKSTDGELKDWANARGVPIGLYRVGDKKNQSDISSLEVPKDMLVLAVNQHLKVTPNVRLYGNGHKDGRATEMHHLTQYWRWSGIPNMSPPKCFGDVYTVFNDKISFLAILPNVEPRLSHPEDDNGFFVCMNNICSPGGCDCGVNEIPNTSEWG